MHPKLIAVLASALAIVFMADAQAGRPTAPTSIEGVCAVLSDATPSLETLCVNYCEARDCVNSDDPECDNLLANYDRHREESDPEMPCLPTCPCISPGELRDHSVELTQCIIDSNFIAIFDEVTTAQGAGTGTNASFNHCIATDSYAIPVIWRMMTLDLDEYLSCRA